MKKTQHGWCGSTRSRDIGRSAYLLHQSQGGWSLSLDRAQAVIGRPLTPAVLLASIVELSGGQPGAARRV